LQLNRTVFVLIPIAAILTLLFFFGGPDYYSTRSFKHFWDLGHIVFFAIFTYIILSLWQKLSNQTFWRQCAWIFGITLCFGVIVEIGQSGIGRSPDFGDLIRDFIGASLVLFFLTPARKRVPKLMLRISQVVTVTAIVIGLVPLAIALTDEWTAENQFPVLSDFETPFEIDRWRGDAEFAADRNIAFHGKSSLKVQLNTSTYSGVGLKYFPRDWQGFRALEFSIYNPSSEPLKMTCRVHDRQHTRGPGPELYSDRFNRSFLLSKGWNPITIDLEEIAQAPKNRRMNMSQIQGISVFAVQLPQPRLIYLDYIRLSK
jgi:VanZ family protein